MKKTLLVYMTGNTTGLSTKADKIKNGFQNDGFTVDALFFSNHSSKFSHFIKLVVLNLKFLLFVLMKRYSIIYIRFTYYFIGIYFLAWICRKNFQMEINSKLGEEHNLRGDYWKAILEKLALELAVKRATRIHLVSKELLKFYNEKFPYSNFVFTPNFVVDEYFIDRENAPHPMKKLHVVFLGNTSQKWHGVDLFIKKAIFNNTWFLKHCHFHLVGACSLDIHNLIKSLELERHVTIHGFLQGEEKYNTMSKMDIGISGFNLNVIGLKERTGIKIGEYLYSGLAIIIGYDDPALPADLPFVLKIDLNSSQNSQALMNTFIEKVVNSPCQRKFAHDFAKNNLVVKNYISNIVAV